jgi:hypothetical protein
MAGEAAAAEDAAEAAADTVEDAPAMFADATKTQTRKGDEVPRACSFGGKSRGGGEGEER